MYPDAPRIFWTGSARLCEIARVSHSHQLADGLEAAKSHRGKRERGNIDVFDSHWPVIRDVAGTSKIQIDDLTLHVTQVGIDQLHPRQCRQ